MMTNVYAEIFHIITHPNTNLPIHTWFCVRVGMFCLTKGTSQNFHSAPVNVIYRSAAQPIEKVQPLMRAIRIIGTFYATIKKHFTVFLQPYLIAQLLSF